MLTPASIVLLLIGFPAALSILGYVIAIGIAITRYWFKYHAHFRGECPCGYSTSWYLARRFATIAFYLHYARKHPKKVFLRSHIRMADPFGPILLNDTEIKDGRLLSESLTRELKEGDIVERSGFQFRVKSNPDTGNLFLSSLGQIGRNAGSVDPAKFAEQTRDAAKEQLSQTVPSLFQNLRK